MSRILILGAYGRLGCSLSEHLGNFGHTVLRQSRSNTAELSLNPLDVGSLTSTFLEQSVDLVINLVALTDVDACQSDINSAYKINVGVVEATSLAMSCLPVGKRPHLIQVSTDHLYGGEGPHVESQVAPCNVYALSKLAGEIAATRADATILRTNFIGRSHANNRPSLTDWIVESLIEDRPLTVYEDVRVSALHISTLCEAIQLVNNFRQPGVYNIGCSTAYSKAYLAFQLAEKLGLPTDLMTIGKYTDNHERFPRPLDMSMDSNRFSSDFGFKLPDPTSQIELTVRDYVDE